MSQNPREIALEILLRAGKGTFVEDILAETMGQTTLSPADRGLCQELVYGVIRWQAALDWLISKKTQHPPDKQSLRDLLRIGLYQIFWLDRVPNHAAVNETVEAAKHRGLVSQSGFINAVLRNALRDFDALRKALSDLKEAEPWTALSHPQWLFKRWDARHGREATLALMTWDNTPPKTYARVNTLKEDPAKLLEQWREENVEYDFVRRDWFDENLVFELKSHPPIDRLRSFREGAFYIQDPGTLLSAAELAAKPGETILDLCAAPGGKLTFIAQQMRNEGKLLAHDIDPERIKLVKENCKRLGVTCVEILAADALETQRPGSIDRILIDAPCSNTGVMRRRVDLRWRIREEEIARLRSVQLALLAKAAPLLRPGGMLLYSTCSLEPEENEQVVREFLASNPWFKLESERGLLPFEDNVDGAYVAKMVKTG